MTPPQARGVSQPHIAAYVGDTSDTAQFVQDRSMRNVATMLPYEALE
jgi:hypothetical protein